MNFFDNIADTQITRRIARPLIPTAPRRSLPPRRTGPAARIARAAVLEVLG